MIHENATARETDIYKLQRANECFYEIATVKDVKSNALFRDTLAGLTRPNLKTELIAA